VSVSNLLDHLLKHSGYGLVTGPVDEPLAASARRGAMQSDFREAFNALGLVDPWQIRRLVFLFDG
jgi:hypothetical protein